MKKILILICLPFWVFSQNTIGFPDVVNYYKQSYGGGLQNWSIKQDRNGIIYVANNEGLLTFDGKNCNIYPLPNKTIVRSVEIGLDNKIYVGGQDELGYFSTSKTSKNGRLEYHSLTQSILPKDKSFGDVWEIVSINKDVFFRTTNKIFKFSNESVAVFVATSEWTRLAVCSNHLYAHDLKTGLLVFENNGWASISSSNQLPANDVVTSIIPLQGDSIWVSTLKHGLYILSKNGIAPLQSSNNNLFANDRIYAATKVNAEWIALATSNQGVYIINWKGEIIQSFSKTEGLQNNNVLSIFLDAQHNLWLGLNNGIDLIAYNSSIKQINPFLQDGSGYTATVFNDRLYIGTSTGLCSVALQPTTDLSFSKGNFEPVNNAKGQTWGLATINNQLLLANHEGAFTIKDNTALPISDYPGYWNFLPLGGTYPATQMVGGNYKGMAIFDCQNGQYSKPTPIAGFNESSRFVAIDKFDNIWVSHPYHGVFRVRKKNDGSYSTYAYADKKGLPCPLNNHVFKIKNEVVFATEKGVYTYNPLADSFQIAPFYNKLLGSQGIRYMKEDVEGNVWFVHEKSLGVIDFTGKEPTVIYISELRDKLLSGFECMYPINKNNILVGSEKGFFHINYEKYKRSMPELKVQVREVRIINKTDSLLFGGYFNEINEPQTQQQNSIPEIANEWKTVRFEYAAPLFGFQSNLEYSFRLKGFDNNWSQWTKRTEKDYTNLPAGNYTLEIKVRNNLGNESSVSYYSFTILPPWYMTWWAYLFYCIVFVVGNYMAFIWLQNKFRLQREKFITEQERLLYIHDLEINKSESELVALRNEKLESDINFKNSELASSAMHLLKKGELLTKIKTELSRILKDLDNQHAIGEIKKLIRTLNEDEHLDDEWENFANHFDQVHSDFLTEIKEIHPTVTPNELKLCAYLRMNLSTKEMAQLMNISVRGVEIARYRLRKKLAIPTEISLFDYLKDIKGKG